MERFAEPILHVDMDAFYVEVERLERPELRGAPVIVGGLGNRGVVAAASYEARRFGVGSAMPMARARTLCPQAHYLSPDMAKYQTASRAVFTLFDEFTPLVEALSIDEAFLDVAGLRRHYPDGEAVGHAIRRRLGAELGLPASVGVATTKFLAKLASEAAKPDGLVRVPAGRELDFLHPLPIRALWGVGRATQEALESIGVATVGEVAELPLDALRRRVGDAAGRHLHDLAWGRDPRVVTPGSAAKSISVEETYGSDITDPDRIDEELLAHCERLGRRLRSARLAARTVQLKVRYADFTTVSRSVTLDAPVDDTPALAAAARHLWERVPGGQSVRLLGVGGSGLATAGDPRQLTLGAEERRALTDAADRVRERFGEGAIGPARLAARQGRGSHPYGPRGPENGPDSPPVPIPG